MNGQPPPLLTAGPEPQRPAEIDLILAGYAEATRRDAVRAHARQDIRTVSHCLTGICLLLAGLLAWFAFRPQVLYAPIQPVLVVDGQVQPVGPPLDLYAYQPPEGQWMTMLADWVQKWRGRGVDRNLAAWHARWVTMYSCPPALAQVRASAAAEKPPDAGLGPKKVWVVITAVTKTPSATAFNVQWTETVTVGAQAPVVEQWTGTFTVGRVRLGTAEMVTHNRLGLCVDNFDWRRVS